MKSLLQVNLTPILRTSVLTSHWKMTLCFTPELQSTQEAISLESWPKKTCSVEKKNKPKPLYSYSRKKTPQEPKEESSDFKEQFSH